MPQTFYGSIYMFLFLFRIQVNVVVSYMFYIGSNYTTRGTGMNIRIYVGYVIFSNIARSRPALAPKPDENRMASPCPINFTMPSSNCL